MPASAFCSKHERLYVWPIKYFQLEIFTFADNRGTKVHSGLLVTFCDRAKPKYPCRIYE